MVPMTLVSLTEVAAAAAAQRRAVDVHVHHRVHGVSASTLAIAGLPDVGLDEFGAAQVVLRRHRVHRDHPVHLGVTLDPAYEPAPQLPGDSGHEHDLAQDQRLPSSLDVPP